MKIMLLAPQPFFEIRGTPLNICNLAKALGGIGYKIDILTYHLGKDIEIENTTIHRTMRLPFVKYIPVGPSYIKIPLDLLLFLKALGMCFRNRYNVIHAVEEAAFFGVILRKLFRIPLIYDMDSSIPQQLSYTKFLKNRVLLNLAECLERWTIKNSVLVLTVCSNLTRLVSKKYPQKKIFQIEDIPIPTIKETPSEEIINLKKDLGINDKRVILYTGNFEGYQGIELLLKSITKVAKSEKNVKFVLVGGEPKQIFRMKKLCDSLNISDFVIFTGKRPVEKIPTFMQMSDILVSPRLAGTNTPLKIFTYLQSGKPIVATDLETHTQLLNKDISVLTKPDSESLSEGIIRLLNDQDKREELGAKGKEFVEKNYNFDIFSDRVKQVYEYVNFCLF